MSDIQSDNRQETRRDAQARIHRKMWLGVAATSVVIVAIWLFMLPAQLQRLRNASKRNDDRWTTVAAPSASVGLRESLVQMREQFEDMMTAIEASENQKEEKADAPAPQAQLPVLEERNGVEKQVELLRARLESASAKE